MTLGVAVITALKYPPCLMSCLLFDVFHQIFKSSYVLSQCNSFFYSSELLYVRSNIGPRALASREALHAHGSIGAATLDDTFKHKSKTGKH